MNKQFFTKVSVLIDKLSYISNNNDFNGLNEIDFSLLKNYSKELYQLLNSTAIEEEKQTIANNTTITKESETPTIPHLKPTFASKPIEIEEEIEAIDEVKTNQSGEELHMKPVSDNIFDTVNSIKHKSKISRLNRLQLSDNEIEDEKTPVEDNTPVVKKITPQVEKEEVAVATNEVIEEAEVKPTFLKETIEEEQEEENLSLNDRFKQPESSVADKVANNNFKNLKELIDINDRFLFIQKLFGGSYLAFEESVNQINNISTYSEALDYIDYKIKSNFDWDNNSEEVAKFLNILEKKYN